MKCQTPWYQPQTPAESPNTLPSANKRKLVAIATMPAGSHATERVLPKGLQLAQNLATGDSWLEHLSAEAFAGQLQAEDPRVSRAWRD
jgi:hypothetical protein